MAIDWARSLRGGMAGAVAAGVWAAQQPLDKRVFDSDYDDAELLGTALTRGAAAYPLGLALHLANGAAFGAAYAVVAHRIPLPAWSRGPLAAQLENFALWPLGRVVDHLHPARGDRAPLTSNRRALAQATWRHLVFGVVLGELERRLNPPEEPLPADYDAIVSTNGHGSLEDAVAAGAASSP
jgi:hypothetical protein